LPNSLNQFVLSRLGLLSQSTSASSWYGFLHSVQKFFMGSGNQQIHQQFKCFYALRSTFFLLISPFGPPPILKRLVS